jgi:hypothetical protein
LGWPVEVSIVLAVTAKGICQTTVDAVIIGRKVAHSVGAKTCSSNSINGRPRFTIELASTQALLNLMKIGGRTSGKALVIEAKSELGAGV